MEAGKRRPTEATCIERTSRKRKRGASSFSAAQDMRTSPVVLLVLLVLGSILDLVSSCAIQGIDIGVCDTDLETDVDYRIANLPFCYPYIKYPACVPKYNPLPPSRDYPNGRWYNNTMLHKDNWIETMYYEVVLERLKIENNKKLQKKGVDEYGDSGAPATRFTHNDDCKNAYMAYMCWINFPRCDDDKNSLVTCKSACENMMIACEYPSDLWRCGSSMYFNGYEPESPSVDAEGRATYLRDFYPGQPFIKYEDGNRDCTPALKGAAASLKPPWLLMMGIVMLLTVVCLLASW